MCIRDRRQEFRIAQLARLLLEHLDELPPNDLAFLLRVTDAAQCLEEPALGLHADNMHLQALREGLHDLIAFVLAQQALSLIHISEMMSTP